MQTTCHFCSGTEIVTLTVMNSQLLYTACWKEIGHGTDRQTDRQTDGVLYSYDDGHGSLTAIVC